MSPVKAFRPTMVAILLTPSFPRGHTLQIVIRQPLSRQFAASLPSK